MAHRSEPGGEQDAAHQRTPRAEGNTVGDDEAEFWRRWHDETRTKSPTADDLIRYARRFGPESVLEVAEATLDQAGVVLVRAALRELGPNGKRKTRGRPRRVVLTSADVRQLVEAGQTTVEIANRTGMTPKAVRALLAESGT